MTQETKDCIRYVIAIFLVCGALYWLNKSPSGFSLLILGFSIMVGIIITPNPPENIN